MSWYFSPQAMINRWFGRSPSRSEERFETRYRETPERQPTPAGSVVSGAEMRVEDSGALLQQVEGPNGPPRGRTTSWAPQDLVTSTPAVTEMGNYFEVRYPATVPELLTPVTGQAGAHGNGNLNSAAGPIMSPGSMYGDEETQQ